MTGGISEIVVVDPDSPEACRWAARNLPYTPWQTKTPGGGYHLFYRHPGRPVSNRARIETRDGRLELDARGDGGYVIAPGSLHANGGTYLQAGDWSVRRDRLPVFWEGWLARPQRPVRPAHVLRPAGGDVTERARRYLARVPRPELGQGSDAATLYAACRLVRGFGLSAGEAEALLWDWCGNREGWTPEWVQRKVAHAERYGSEPIGALR